ncbi:MAG TPA: hypothetical protein VF702_09625 [Allosphingosinicella sp.]
MKIRPFMLAAALVAAGLTTLAGISPALASAATVAVEHSDLNLDSASGRAAYSALRVDSSVRAVH